MDRNGVFEFVQSRLPELAERTSEHLMLTCVSTLAAAILGLLLAILAYRVRSVREPIMSVVGILQTIPSLAMLVFLMTVLGCIGMKPALVALTLYALLPICRNSLLGLISTPPALVEAARGLGMTELQQLLLVRLPIAVPSIVAGLRTAAVVGVGIATLSAFIGAGGLGEFINRGLALSDSRLILLGAIPSGILAIIADLSLAAAEWAFRPVRPTDKPLDLQAQKFRRWAAASLPSALCLGSLLFYVVEHPFHSPGQEVRIGTKHFTEQFVLGELIAQTLEKRTNLSVSRRFDLGGTMICHGALERGEVDIYPEYTGTALLSILKMARDPNPIKTFATVKQEYDKRYQIRWLEPFGFNNTWALIVNQAEAGKRNWKCISDLRNQAPALKIGVPGEFAERSDGYPGMCSFYGLNFASLKDIDTNLSYKAVSEHQIDVTAGNSTDGHIQGFRLLVLADDKKFFPPYQAAPIIRESVLQLHPEIADVLKLLAGAISDDDMRRLNFEVDGKRRSPAQVAHDFLLERKIIN